MSLRLARFVLLHTFTTVPILLPIHIHFSDSSVSQRSMTRASISSMVGAIEGTRLLWIHIILLFYVALSWIASLIWICRGVFQYRKAQIQRVAESCASATQDQNDSYHPHPHPQYPFLSLPVLDGDQSNRGLRLRTLMVTNIPLHLRSEKDLTDYFEYYLSRPGVIPAVVLSLQPGFFNKLVTAVYNRSRRVLEHIHEIFHIGPPSEDGISRDLEPDTNKVPLISRVVVGRKLTTLSSLLEQREDILQSLEAAHIKLARNVLSVVKEELDKREGCHIPETRNPSLFKGGEGEEVPLDMDEDDKNVREQLIRTLRPFVEEFGLRSGNTSESKALPRHLSVLIVRHSEQRDLSDPNRETVWEALHSLPPSVLDSYQPLTQLSHRLHGRSAPEIDHFTVKLNCLTTLITEDRARAIEHHPPVSTAFVTFSDPRDARRACRYLSSHPDSPINCVVQMAPSFEDLDWTRIMKSTFKAEVSV
jgi:hypothetical protein